MEAYGTSIRYAAHTFCQVTASRRSTVERTVLAGSDAVAGVREATKSLTETSVRSLGYT